MMQHFFSTVFILFAIAFQLLGCSERRDDDPNQVETPISEPVSVKPTPENTFAKLKTLFPKPILDEDFITLRAVTTSKTYLDFLTQTYQTEKPFGTLAEYLNAAPPDPETYKPFLKEFIGNSNEEDLAIIHQVTLQYRCANAVLYQMLKEGNVVQGLPAVLEKKLSILDEAPIKAWLALHLPDPEQLQSFFQAFETFVTETERADTFLIQQHFEDQGTDNGILWVALHNPALTAEILNNFTDTDVFLKWTDGDFFSPEP